LKFISCRLRCMIMKIPYFNFAQYQCKE
jgi:hypothetical protein